MTRSLDSIRGDFPALHQEVHGKPLVYLDSAATALKPQAVIDAITSVYASDCANIHRGVHQLSQRATNRFEEARAKVRTFLGAGESHECIFTSGVTEGMNLIASSYGRTSLKEGDEVLVTGLEHHSNIVPWQMACKATGAKLVVAEMDPNGEVPIERIASMINERTEVVSTLHVSNALGTVQDIAAISELAHEAGAVMVVDGAQAAPHVKIDMQALGADFYCIAGHKLYGPTGIGVLCGRKSLLNAMPPYKGGGDMILTVTFEESTYNVVPHRFEAGTPNIAGAIGLAAAIDYIGEFDHEALLAREAEVLAYGTKLLSGIDGVNLVGTAKHKVGALSFTLDCAHPHDIGTILDMEGVAVRTGHHCTQPIMDKLGIPATARASLGIYNNEEDLDRLGAAIGKVLEMFG